ncbi:MAG: metallophosphoesterase, partial [Muribaculaceae bacterium]|nr:metallophosphoesterase [Muribaculaceae bacterium]
MKRILSLFVMLMVVVAAFSESRLVILHTNDTHSQIDPTDKDKGGVLRRKALVDSVRGVNKNVLLVDAGDAVQGTVYFNLFKGEVEQQMMNIMGYDLRIIGNHEFDNGIEGLKSMVEMSKAQTLSTNYLFEDSLLRNKIAPYIIKCIG